MSHLIVEDSPGLRQAGQSSHCRENHPAHSSTVIIWLLRVTIPCSEGLIQHRLPLPSMLVQGRAIGSKSSNLDLPERLRPTIANGASCLLGSALPKRWIKVTDPCCILSCGTPLATAWFT